MRRVLLSVSAAFATAACFGAADHAGLAAESFAAVLPTNGTPSVAFAPAAFFWDAIVFSEAYDPIARAKMAETLSEMNGLEPAFHPSYEALLSETNAIAFRSARGFCLPDERRTPAAYRRWLQDSFGAEAFGVACRAGAAQWFRTMLDGEIDSFAIPTGSASPGHYSYFELVSVRIAIPASPCRIDRWERFDATVTRVKLDGEYSFIAIRPKKDATLASVRNVFARDTAVATLDMLASVTEQDVTHETRKVALPAMDLTTENDLTPVFGRFAFPLTGSFEKFEKNFAPTTIRQTVRLRIVSAAAKDAAALRIDGPFLFFVIHDISRFVPVAGQCN